MHMCAGIYPEPKGFQLLISDLQRDFCFPGLGCAAKGATSITNYVGEDLAKNPFMHAQENIALCVLFSGGTFLYAACMHILPEIMGDNGKLSKAELAGMLFGSAVPIFCSALQGDHHH